LSLQENGEITSEDWDALRNAVKSLEHPSLAGRLTNIVGKPVELIGYALPTFASEAITSATSKGLEAALKVALRKLRSSSSKHSQLLHRALATASGAAGGTFGLAALVPRFVAPSGGSAVRKLLSPASIRLRSLSLIVDSAAISHYDSMQPAAFPHRNGVSKS
jgi:hypothetical protein